MDKNNSTSTAANKAKLLLPSIGTPEPERLSPDLPASLKKKKKRKKTKDILVPLDNKIIPIVGSDAKEDSVGETLTETNATTTTNNKEDDAKSNNKPSEEKLNDNQQDATTKPLPVPETTASVTSPTKIPNVIIPALPKLPSTAEELEEDEKEAKKQAEAPSKPIVQAEAPKPTATAPSLPPSNNPPLFQSVPLKTRIADFVSNFALEPDSKPKLIWNAFACVFIVYNIIALPLRACFALYSIPEWVVPDLIADVVLWLDIVLHFFTGFEDNGKLVLQKKSMAKNYITGWFLVDVAAQVPLDLVGWIWNYYPWWRIQRVLRITRTSYYFSSFEKLFNASPVIIQLAQTGFVIFVSAHLVGCGYYQVIAFDASIFNPDFVPGGANILELNLFGKYIRSFWWSLVNLTGYNNTTPKNDLEVIYTLFVIMLGLSIMVTFVGTVGSLIERLDASNSEFNQRMDEIEAFMNYRKLPPHLRQQIRDYFVHLWQSRRSLKEEKVLEDLPVHLQTEVAMSLNSDVIKKVPFFQNVDKQFINSIVVKLKPKLALPNVYIVRKGQIGKEMFFINKGEVEVVSEDGKIVFATLGAGNVFGEIALVYNTRRTASIRAKSYCDLFIMTKDDFNTVLKSYPQQAEIISEQAKARYATQKK